MNEPDTPPIFDALVIPTEALDRGGVEVLRAAIVEGGLHVSLRRAFDDPDAWGMLLADLTRHAGLLYARETARREDVVVERVRAMYQREFDEPTDPGTTSAVS